MEVGKFYVISKFDQLKERIAKNKKYILKSTTDSGSKNVFLINQNCKKMRKILNDRKCYETNLSDLKNSTIQKRNIYYLIFIRVVDTMLTVSQ